MQGVRAGGRRSGSFLKGGGGERKDDIVDAGNMGWRELRQFVEGATPWDIWSYGWAVVAWLSDKGNKNLG
jgi:hypothetical protein